MGFICECGKEFETERSLWSHQSHCSSHEKKIKPRNNIYKINENLYRCECGKEFNKFQSVVAHFRHCLEHKRCLGKPLILLHPPKGKMNGWENFTKADIANIRKKAGKTISKRISDGEIIPSFKNKKHSEQSKEKTRLSTIKYIESLKGSCRPRYSKKCCEFIDKLNEQNNWNLQHAENGGEISIAGYFVDGFDKQLNIVFEYDEPYHYIDKYNNILSDRDIERQNYIISKTNCEFWRYNEYLDLLYKIA